MERGLTQQAVRVRWQIRGQVQGVGFRPFVYRTASRYGLTGFVHNDPDGVTIEAQGSPQAMDGLRETLESGLPPLAEIERMSCVEIHLHDQERLFQIRPSHLGTGPRAAVTVDTSVCEDCVTELFHPLNRRRNYGVINCTNCGPRYTILQRVPYDRPNTTMAVFTMCAPCNAEYNCPSDRRFHAQPIACHKCGPQLQLVTSNGRCLEGDPITSAIAQLKTGSVVAIKGIGGFHLAVRADDSRAVAGLRTRKRRPDKPLAILCSNLDVARRLVDLGDPGTQLLDSPARPIVLAPRKSGAPIASEVAPGSHRLGVMLPYTPIHHLLFGGNSELSAIVMTSGNVSDEPLAIDNDDAIERLGPLCDSILWHDRTIQRCVDDSVFIDFGSSNPLPIRRSRGFVPRELHLPVSPKKEMEHGLCVGGELKNTVAVVRGSEVILSQHLGDLTHPLAFENFKDVIDDLQSLFGVSPRWIATDLHPQYLSTVHAKWLAKQWNVPLLGIQHHHAHAAAVMAEHGERGPILALVLDGVGYGTDGTMWGGELLLASLIDFRRIASLRPLRLAGGDVAAKETSRCAVALVRQIVGDDLDSHPVVRRLLVDPNHRRLLATMLRRNVNCVESSAMGRVFDGVASLLGLCQRNRFEAQAAMRLETAAHGFAIQNRSSSAPASHESWLEIDRAATSRKPLQLDLATLVKRLLELQKRGMATSELAYLFHDRLAAAWVSIITKAARQTGMKRVALSGGVFCNQLLTELLTARLSRHGFCVLRHRHVPPNDGGLSLGQAAIATARLSRQNSADTMADWSSTVAETQQESELCV